MSAKEALYDFIFGDEFDEDVYESKEEAIDDLVDEQSYQNYGLDVFECDGGEYVVADSYSDAEEAARDSVKSLIDDIGVEGFNVTLSNFVSSDWFEDAEREGHEFYFDDIVDESSSDEDEYVNRAHEECVDFGLIGALDLPEMPEESDYLDDEGEEDADAYSEAYDEWESEVESIKSEVEDEVLGLKDDFVEKMMSSDSIEYHIDNFGEDSFNDAVKRNGLVDEDELAEHCVDIDGVAHFLASYDGEEYEQDGYYIYRTN